VLGQCSSLDHSVSVCKPLVSVTGGDRDCTDLDLSADDAGPRRRWRRCGGEDVDWQRRREQLCGAAGGAQAASRWGAV